MIDAAKYGITVRAVEVDGDSLFEATVAEFPDLAIYGASFGEAYEGAIATIDSAVFMLKRTGQSIPSVVRPEREYSGRITLRISKSLHRTISDQADSDGVSLNQHIVSILSHFSGYAAPRVEEAVRWETLRSAPTNWSRTRSRERKDFKLTRVPVPANGWE